VCPDHDGPGPGKARFPERQAYQAGIRLAVLDVIAAGSRLDEFIDVQKRQIMLQLGAFAVSGQGYLAPRRVSVSNTWRTSSKAVTL
jgi:hypothetical protein